PAAGAEVRTLAPLSPRAGEMLVRQVLGPVDPGVIASLVARADGNPFFLEELLRAGGGDGSALPDSVLSVVQARLRALDDESRRLLRAASVFDGAFAPAAVAHLLGAPVEAARARIQALVDAELLALERGDGAVYRFRHGLVQGAAYATL